MMETSTLQQQQQDLSSGHNGTDPDKGVIQARRVINAFIPPLLIVVGCFFNALIVLGMRTKHFRSLSTSVYMTVGAVNDFFSLLVLLTAHWMHVNFPHTIARGKDAHVLCKFFNFYAWGQTDFGLILTSVMTADRAYVILRPMTTKDLVKQAKVAVVVCFGIVLAKDLHFWFSSVMMGTHRADRLCDVTYTSATYHSFYHHYWPWLDTMFVTACFIVMVTSNVILVAHVRNSRKGTGLVTASTVDGGGARWKEGDSVNNTSSGGGDPSGMIRTSSIMSIHTKSRSLNNVGNQITKMLLAESLAFILLSYPFSFHLIITSLKGGLQEDDEVDVQANALAFNVVLYMLYANKCINFLVYCRARKKFRKTIVEDVLCQFRLGQFRFGRGAGDSLEAGSWHYPGSTRDPSTPGPTPSTCPTKHRHVDKKQQSQPAAWTTPGSGDTSVGDCSEM